MTSTSTQQPPAADPGPQPPETAQCVSCLAERPDSELLYVRLNPEVRGCKDLHACTDRVIARLNRIARGR